MSNHILIPVALDHEKVAEKKIAVARRLLDPGGRITLLTVLESVPGFVAEFSDMKPDNHLTTKIREKLKDVAGSAGDIAVEVTTGKAGVEIARYAERNDVDLIVVGSHAPGIEDYFLGSTASRVARRAHCSVYILR